MKHYLKRNIGNVVNIILTQGKVTFGLRDVFVLRPLNVTVERSAVDGLGLGQGLVPGDRGTVLLQVEISQPLLTFSISPGNLRYYYLQVSNNVSSNYRACQKEVVRDTEHHNIYMNGLL